MIPDEFEAFMASLDQDLYKALRINTKKVDPDRFPEPGLLGKPSPFADHSWYVDRPLGLDPYHILRLVLFAGAKRERSRGLAGCAKG